MISRLNKAVTSIYEDRVVVGNYILQLSNHIEEVIQLLKSNNNNSNLQYLNSLLTQIDSISTEYDKTYLTETEKVNFMKFTSYSQQIKSSINSSSNSDALSKSVEAQKVLKVLSSIQVEEGKDKLDEVLGMTNTRSMLSYLEIVIIIVISILIQKIILSTKPLVIKKTEDKHNLN